MAIPVGRVVSGDVVEGWFDLKVFGPANRHGQVGPPRPSPIPLPHCQVAAGTPSTFFIAENEWLFEKDMPLKKAGYRRQYRRRAI